ncbi:MAG: MBL fold metallo-hydrolase [Promethearchaeota archaeon]|nr:MAG: MBL fold metallo-hydrolase [Candidatus Lokiarchaeota archaeon]
MAECQQWFEVIKQKEYLYVIREKLAEIDPRFNSVYTNLFLLIGSKSALLIDTGAGVFSLKPIIDELIGMMDLKVVNTHCHWDHVGGNHEFNEIYIHENEKLTISRPINITNLRSSPKDIVKRYEKFQFSLPPASSVKPLKDGDIIDLGDLALEIIHTPGHSPGSICLLSNRNELFTGDTAHFGTPYLPKKKMFPEVLTNLSKLINLCEKQKSIEIYPSHEEFGVGIELLSKLYNGISNIENIWDKRVKNDFMRSWIIDDGKFKYDISRI